MALRLGILNISFRNGKPREFEPRLHQRVLFIWFAIFTYILLFHTVMFKTTILRLFELWC